MADISIQEKQAMPLIVISILFYHCLFCPTSLRSDGITSAVPNNTNTISERLLRMHGIDGNQIPLRICMLKNLCRVGY